jgi:hypothetical protein
MSDQTEFENDFEATDEAAAAAAPANELPEAPTNAEVAAQVEAPAVDDFFAEDAAPAMPEVDPARVITLVPSSSDNRYVEAREGETAIPMLDLISRAQLRFEGNFQCYLNNTEISLTTLVPAGSTVSIVGKVKGG